MSNEEPNPETVWFNNNNQREWNKNRQNFLVSLLGEDWFSGKRVLEVACGLGTNGRFLKEKFGSKLVFADANKDFVNYLKSLGEEAYVMDQDSPWTIDQKFDLIIHWGVLYHLKNWKQDLTCALERSPLLCMETIVWDSDNVEFEFEREEKGYDQALNGLGVVTTAKNIEKHFDTLGATYTRYDSSELDSNCATYSWQEKFDQEKYIDKNRRFWMVKRN